MVVYAAVDGFMKRLEGPYLCGFIRVLFDART